MSNLIITYALNGLLMIGFPIFLALHFGKRWKISGRIWWIGTATFIFSQIVHIPINLGIENLLQRSGIIYWSLFSQQVVYSVFLGFSAGIHEEIARYLVLRFWMKSARSWRTAIIFGLGHGGVEAIILGIFALLSYTSMLFLKNSDVSLIFQPSQVELVKEQISTYWSVNWYDSMLGALERFFSIPIQLALTVIVMQTFIRKNIGWLFLAILLHALIDGMVVFLSPYMGIYWTELIIGVLAGCSIGIIFIFKKPEPVNEYEPQSVKEVKHAP